MESLKTIYLVSMMRAVCTIGDNRRDKNKKISDDIEVINNEYYGKNDTDHKLEMYRPKEASGKLPVIVSIHGGAYLYGSIKTYRYYCANLASYGFFVVNFNYKLAPKAKYPEIMYSVNDVMNYVFNNADRLNIDLNNVFIVGDSAGGQMANQYGLIYSNKEYQKLMNIIPPKFKLKALGLNCGLYELDPRIAKEGNMNYALLEPYFGKDPVTKYGELLETSKYLTSNYPPSFIMTFKGDFLSSLANPLKEKLDKFNIENELHIYGTKDNGHVQHVDYVNEVGKQANNEEIAFFKKHIN